MALPAGVSVPQPVVGRQQFVTQRGYFAPPYVSCMFAALCMILIWEGYELPLERDATKIPPENFVWTLHKQSGAALDSGTTIANTKTAMSRLLPDAPMNYGSGTSTDLINLLSNGAALRVIVKCPSLTTYLRRWVGTSYTGQHACAIIGTRMNAGVREVFWLDPMGRPSQYSGEWVAWSDITPAITKNSAGNYVATWGYRGTAVDPNPAAPPPPTDPPPPPPDPTTDPVDPPPAPLPDAPPVVTPESGTPTGIVPRQRGTIPAGTPVLHPVTLDVLYYMRTSTEVRIYGTTADGAYKGIVSRTSGTEGNRPKLVLVPADAVTNLRIAP